MVVNQNLLRIGYSLIHKTSGAQESWRSTKTAVSYLAALQRHWGLMQIWDRSFDIQVTRIAFWCAQPTSINTEDEMKWAVKEMETAKLCSRCKKLHLKSLQEAFCRKLNPLCTLHYIPNSIPKTLTKIRKIYGAISKLIFSCWNKLHSYLLYIN